MSDGTESNERETLKGSVFKPGRAQIAREMKCRLDLCSDEQSGATRKHRERD